ncbi:hypothetical protein CPJCM30710_00030 [Clostridium polyendosporum]|uniref:Uncharacterized protein n=1 Tax=Clostridium polyendosporum TaxID=69208 RepID=A0A919RW08_9CLOT|nr:hypothetical protein [Clostridium polyendosporum]GIM27337.1 hypothetical protein CPJCM30710_00030 [Clostridium polyendosporum]
MLTKNEKNKRNDSKNNNPKTSNPITMEKDTNMRKPVRGLD